MDNFWHGFEKQAFAAGVLKRLGKLTGVSQIRTGVRQMQHMAKRPKQISSSGQFPMPGYGRRYQQARKNVRRGAFRLAGTGVATAGTAALAGAASRKKPATPQPALPYSHYGYA